MSDWSSALNTALAAGDPAFMKAMLARVPRDVLTRAIPYLERMADDNAREGKLAEALTYYDQLIEFEPANVEWRAARARVHFRLDQPAEAMVDAKSIAEQSPENILGIRLQAEAHELLRERPQALAMYRNALRIAPNDEKIKERIRFLESELQKEALLRQTFNPEAGKDPLTIEPLPPPKITFDPGLFDDPSIPSTFEKPMVDGLKQLLLRYSAHQSCKNVLTRIEDPVWLAAWNKALSATAGLKTLFYGSEFGLFPLRALKLGAEKATIVERSPIDARICSGILQKHFLTDWRALHGDAIQSWSEEERKRSFEAHAQKVDLVAPDSDELGKAECDCLLLPNIDHSLLGTGIIKAIRKLQGSGVAKTARIFPAKAKIYAMGIQWIYPSTAFALQPINRLRWSLYPETLDLPSDDWQALTEPKLVGEIDFQNFSETNWSAELNVSTNGNVHAILFWFELDLGNATISNAPDNGVSCIRPGVQYTDSFAVVRNQQLSLRIQVTATRLSFQTEPRATQLRSGGLPSWYIPMLLDRERNDAYRTTLAKALEDNPSQLVFDIGAGCGLLSMMAAQTGATRVIGCEVNPAIAEIGDEILKINRAEQTVALINKDCRKIAVPGDLPERADLAIFELFDCSLIGEGVLHFLAYAREHLLKENARYLPAAAKIRAMLIEYRVDKIWDIDVNILNPFRFSPSFINVDAKILNHCALTDPFDVFSFDFRTATPTPEEKELSIVPIDSGIIGAVLFWFDLKLDDDLWISNDPTKGGHFHWKQGLQFLPEIRVGSGMTTPLIAKHDGSGLAFQWKQDALPKEALSLLPRFDPRYSAAAAELDHQTRGLLQHCAQNPSEYEKVAEIAKRFAIDPAEYDIDPTIAQRFASMFIR